MRGLRGERDIYIYREREQGKEHRPVTSPARCDDGRRGQMEMLIEEIRLYLQFEERSSSMATI